MDIFSCHNTSSVPVKLPLPHTYSPLREDAMEAPPCLKKTTDSHQVLSETRQTGQTAAEPFSTPAPSAAQPPHNLFITPKVVSCGEVSCYTVIIIMRAYISSVGNDTKTGVEIRLMIQVLIIRLLQYILGH